MNKDQKMMKKNIVLCIGLVTACLFNSFSITPVKANEAQEQIEEQLHQYSNHIDANYGVLLSSVEMENLKIALIVDSTVTDEAIEQGKTAQQLATQAIANYQIEDIMQQRQLLIEIDATMTAKGSGGGAKPKCC